MTSEKTRPAIRNSAKALIVRDDQLLAIQHEDSGGIYYALPGGGQEPGETLAEAVRRECQEELGADVVVRHLAFVRERVDELPDHRVEFAFHCTLQSEPVAHRATHPDDGQRGIVWLPIAQLGQTRFFPLGIRSLITELVTNDGAMYLGHLP